MPDPVDSLDAPIDWRDPALWPILSDLQGNILKGHGRDHTQNIFLRFDPSRVADVRKAIRSLAANVTSALTQLRETSAFKIVGRPGGTAVYLAISAAGYRAIGLTPPGNPAFLHGMAARATDLCDPDETEWEDHLRGVHAVLIVADDSDTLVGNAAALLTAGLAEAGITVLGRDSGRALRRGAANGGGKGEGVEHFGCGDGRHQPLLIAEDVAAERARDRSFTWDPGFSPRACALVRDPHGAFGESFGSYLVYRKLEQNVAAFQAHEHALAGAAEPVGPDRERAGVVPHVDHVAGAVCNCLPKAGVGPYGGTEPGPGKPVEKGHTHLMPRRGIAYGERADGPGQGGAVPSTGVGLLFMAYNSDIGRQFEFTQKCWVNRPAVVDDARAGPVVGRAEPGVPSQSCRVRFDAPPVDTIQFAFANFVTLKGGEYLFAPSLSALAAL